MSLKGGRKSEKRKVKTKEEGKTNPTTFKMVEAASSKYSAQEGPAGDCLLRI